MITRIINFALDQRFVTLALVLLLVALGVAAFHLMEEALAFTLRRRLVALALTALTACGSLVEMPAPSPDGPRISDLAFDPAVTIVGCPVTMHFRFETNGDRITGGLVRWSVAQGRRLTTDGLPLAAETFGGRPSGEAIVTLRPNKVGHYRYRVQVEDSARRRSNILEQGQTAEVSWSWWITACAQDRR